MVIKNVLIYTEEKVFIEGAVKIEDDRIARVFVQEAESEECLDGAGCYLIPGMIDVHMHGCMGYDFCDGKIDAVAAIARHLASIGVTSFVPATMTLPTEQLESILQIGALFQQKKRQGKYEECADLVGINMEGPFISRTKKGAQAEEYIMPANVAVYERFQRAANGMVKYIGIAPEEYDSAAFIRRVREQVKVSIAHSNADYETARNAFSAGACHVTHLYNGMSAFHHREPGIVGAVMDCKHVEAELICDGLHVHPAVIKNTFSALGAERIILISDSIRAAGMPDGEYELGGQKVIVQGKKATLTNGAIAGSVMTLPENLRYVVNEAGISLEDAVACATVNPAKSLGIYEERGSISAGKKADMVLLNRNLKVQAVVKNGKLL